jgi:uncharacterized protein (DUF1800 family)
LPTSVAFPLGVNTVTIQITPKAASASNPTSRTVVLNVGPGTGYEVGVSGSATVNIAPQPAMGQVLQEIWTNINGNQVSSIPLTFSPTSSRVLTTLENPPSAPLGNNYGTRTRGYIVAPTTGNYTFWIASNNTSELWISSNSQPATLARRARVTGVTNPRQWNAEPQQQSPLLALNAGEKYYFEIYHKQGTGPENLAVGWLKPGEPGTTPSEIVGATPGTLEPFTPVVRAPDGSTLYFANLTPQGGAQTSGSGGSTLRLSGDESFAIISVNHTELTGPLASWHIHGPADPNQSGGILFDFDTSTPQADGTYLWVFQPVGVNSVGDIVNAIKTGRTYVNLHTEAYPTGEIRGHYGRSIGTANFAPPPDPPPWADDHNDANATARFLTQATFGPDAESIALVQRDGYSSFLDQQFAMPVTLHSPYLDNYEATQSDGASVEQTMEAWWKAAITAPDQLRQRVAFALSEIFVVSAESVLESEPFGLSGYYDLLLNNAFGNFRQLLEDVTLSPAMGVYLNMLHNDKPNPETGTSPNENYAREVLQLFSIGLNKLNPDGTLLLDDQGGPIPTYDQNVVVGFAHVFTGWYWTPASGNPNWNYTPSNYRAPMLAYPTHHDMGEKRVLDNVVLPAGQSQAQDLKDALDIIFNHPNVGPFICRQLIQRLVTSNPSPAYIYRVAKIFSDNGQGVRGDLKEVIRAILLDYEARNQIAPTTDTFGHQREPVVRYANLLRAFRGSAGNGIYPLHYLTGSLGQSPLRSPTVFNFFEPNYSQPGAIAAAGLVSPEFQITTDTTVIDSINFMRSLINRNAEDDPSRIVLNWTSQQLALAQTPSALVDWLNTLLMSGQMPTAMRDAIITRVNTINVNQNNPNPDLLNRARAAAYLIIASPQFNIER